MMHPIIPEESTSLVQPQKEDEGGLQATSSTNQLKVLLRRGFIKTVRDQVQNRTLSDGTNYQDFLSDSNLLACLGQRFCGTHVGNAVLASR
jgi:hypothetical protein